MNKSWCLTEFNQILQFSFKWYSSGKRLGALLFILFINDLEEVVASSRVSFFADDTRVSKQIGCFEDCKLLQEDLYKILDWSRSNNMKLHEQTFKLVQRQLLRASRHPWTPLNYYLVAGA